MTRPITLSVLLVTYNHQNYIAKALEGLFLQDWEGPLEVVVADDASSDSTLALIQQAAEQRPDWEFVFLNAEHNQGITRNYERGFGACAGDFVAVLEGDDYWIHPSKLSFQARYLSEHLESDLCSANYYVFDEEAAKFDLRCPVLEDVRLLSARDLIADNLVGNFSTCMYRRSAFDRLPSALFEIQSYDWIVNIWLARASIIAFLPMPLSVYRVHSGGAWSNASHVNKLRLQLSLIDSYDALTNQTFHDEFTDLAGRLRQVIAVEEMGDALKEDLALIRRSGPPLVRIAMSPALAGLRRLIPDSVKHSMIKILKRKK